MSTIETHKRKSNKMNTEKTEKKLKIKNKKINNTI